MQKNNVLSLGLVFVTALVALLPGCFRGCKDNCGTPAAPKTGLYVVSVLDKEFYNDCRIKGSINVPLDEIEKFAQDLDKEKAEVVVYCSDYRCSTSGMAYKKLKELGVVNVYAYEGGAAEWYQMSKEDAGFAIEGECKEAYLNNKIEKPLTEEVSDIVILTAQELKNKIDSAATTVA